MKCLTSMSVGLILIVSSLVSAGTEEPWRGQWIGLDEPCPANTWLCFREQIELGRVPETAMARIACDSKYWLWINGELVVFEGQLKRGPTPKDTYFDRVDLRPHLKCGVNTVAVLLWYWGKQGFSHNSSGKAGLVFDARIGRRRLGSDGTWKVMRHPAYGSTKPPHPNFRLPESNIHFDARRDVGPWMNPGFDDTNWAKATPFGTPPVAPWNTLYERPIPQWKDYGLTNYVSVQDKQNDDGTVTWIGKLPYNCHVTPYLEVETKAGQRIGIQTDNYLGGSAPSVRAVYVTRGGFQRHESLGWMNGHDVRYTMPRDVKVLSLRYRETGYNAAFEGRFTCDDAALNTLWTKAERTLHVTMRDTYMDCPDRERAQWWGDAVNELGEAFYVFDAQRGPLLAKKGIYELARWQRADKTLYSPVPAGVPGPGNLDMKVSDGTWNKELPRQMLASVGWYGFWTYYWYTGDRQTIGDVYPAVRDYLSVWRLGDDGLVVHRPGDWDWTDWGTNKDVPVLENAWLYLTLKGAVEMARLTGHESDVPGYRVMMQSIESHFNKTFWRGDKYHSPSYQGETDDRANALAVVAGLAKPANYPAIRKVLRTQYWASPYMEKYVLESLYLMGAPDEAVARMKKRWAAQIESPLTTLWEGWGLGKEGYGGGTYNHAWSGGPLTALCQYAAGVAPTRAGFEQFAVLPQMGPLQRIDMTTPTPHGAIDLKLRRTREHFTIDVMVPTGTDAVLGVPKTPSAPRTIAVDGRVLWRAGKPTDCSTPIRWLGEDERWIKLAAPAGRILIEVSYGKPAS